jgi:hypothetical protein
MHRRKEHDVQAKEANVGTAKTVQDARELPKEVTASLGKRERDLNFSVLELNDGQHYVLRKDHPKYRGWIELLNDSREGEPLYIETEPGTRRVESMLVPLPKKVLRISRKLKDGYLDVLLFLCPSVCYLNESLGKEKFNTFRKLLEYSRRTGTEVLVTTRPSTMDIIDVRPVEAVQPGSTSNGPVVTVGKPAKMLMSKRRAAPASNTVSLAEARAEFEDLAHNHQIPFAYIRDCCTARAHEMCRIMILAGLHPRKVWNYGHGWAQSHQPPTLRVTTNTVPEGFVTWCYHVAPILSVRTSSGTVKQMVIDPSLFTEPVTIAEWVAKQEDDDATQRRKVPGLIWFDYLTMESAVDPDFVITRRQFRHHRAAANDALH